MELKIFFSEQAGADLDAIKMHISAHDRDAAERVRQKIEQTVDTVSFFPHVGRPTDLEKIQVVPVVRYPYLVYYIANATTLTVVHIRHSSRGTPQSEDFI